MATLLLSPLAALLIDFMGRKYAVARKWTLAILLIGTIPTLLIWLAGYNYSDRQVFWMAVALLVTSFLCAFYFILHVRPAVKLFFAIVATAALAVFSYAVVFLSGNPGQPRHAISTARYKNYLALRIEPPLYSDREVLVVEKTSLQGFIRKTVHETELPAKDSVSNCQYFFKDGRTRLVYDLCHQKLTAP
jgi:hypothetical protein